ncbi:MAG: Lrp/AsnC family transcriptional regulator [Kineosporiaceae bacterium]
MDARGRVDRLDAALVELLTRVPRTSVLEAARRLGVARGTVQARLDRLQRDGVVRGFGPDVDPAAIGYPVTAFCSVEIRQSVDGVDANPRTAEAREAGHAAGTTHDAVARHVAGVPEVLEAHTITGGADLLVRVVARSNADLQRVIDEILRCPHVVRLSTTIALATPLSYRCLPLVHAAANQPNG